MIVADGRLQLIAGLRENLHQRHAIESALWTALRALEESIALSHRLATRAGDWQQSALHDLCEERALGKENHAKVLRDFLLQVNARGEEERIIDEQQAAPGPDLEKSA